MELITHDLYEPRERYIGRKGIYPIIEDYDAIFSSLDIKPILANELDLTTVEGKKLFNELVYSRYEGDVFSNVPRCPCGHTSSGEDEGETCVKCGYVCQAPTEQTIEPLVWIRAPEEVGKFINIHVYQMLKAKLTVQGFSVLDWLIDPKYRPPRMHCVQEEILLQLDIKRGMRYFHDNFDNIMEMIFNASKVVFRSDRRETVRLVKPITARLIAAFLELNRDKVFSSVLPFPSKIGFIIEKVGSMTYIDPEMRPALNAMLSIAKADTECRQLSDAESRTARAVRDLGTYYSHVERNKIYNKQGVLRKLVFGMTPHFTFRTVITSEHLPHDHEVIRIPWGAAVLTFKLHIANKVLKEGYTPNEWLSLIYDNVQRKHHKLDTIFDELIAESPGGRGPPCTFTRFPSLKHNSTTRFFINIKRDPRHMSTSLSIISVKAENADFDGDYMSGMLAVENRIADMFERHAAYTGIMDLKKPHQVSNHCMIPHPVMSTINHMLEVTDELCVPYGE